MPLERISELLKSHNGSSLEKNESYLKVTNDDKIVFCDDLRRGGMTFNTLDIASKHLSYSISRPVHVISTITHDLLKNGIIMIIIIFCIFSVV